MKLASLKGGRDGRLVVVSNDLAWFTEAHHIAPTLQVALDQWAWCEPALRGLAEMLEHGSAPKERFHEHQAASPLPRAYGWQSAGEGGQIRASGSDRFLAPRDAIASDLAGHGAGVEAGVAVITGDVARGATAEAALAAVRLVLLCGEVTLEGAGLDSGQTRAATAFSPVAVTPDVLPGWKGGRLAGALEVELNGKSLTEGDAGQGADFGALVAQAARTRSLGAGSLIGAGPTARAPGLKAGDTVRIEMRDAKRHTVFGAIEQEVAAA